MVSTQNWSKRFQVILAFWNPFSSTSRSFEHWYNAYPKPDLLWNIYPSLNQWVQLYADQTSVYPKFKPRELWLLWLCTNLSTKGLFQNEPKIVHDNDERNGTLWQGRGVKTLQFKGKISGETKQKKTLFYYQLHFQQKILELFCVSQLDQTLLWYQFALM